MAGEGIVLRSSEDPRPGPNEILPRVRASSLNYRDLMVLKGGGRGPTKLGVMPLSDGAGEVAAIGEGVTLVKVGDRVIGTFHPRWFGGPLSADYLTDRPGANLDGMLAEYAVLSEEALVPVPSHLSFEEAATLPCAGSDRLGRTGGPSSGDRRRHRLDAGFGRCLGFCAAICPGLGCPSDRDDLDRRKGRAAQGAGCLRGDHYTETPDWDVKARELTDGRGVDCVVEIGGPGTIAKSLKALAVGGHLSLIGASPVAIGGDARSVIADRPGHYGRGDQRRKPRRFRGNEPDHRAASLAPCDRPDIPVRRGQRSLAISKAAAISARS